MTTTSEYGNFPVGQTFGIAGIPDSITAIGYNDSTNPFIPKSSREYVFRKDLLRDILAYLKSPDGDAVYITGPTGSGKTSAVTEIAARLNWPVQQITCHGRMELTDLIGFHALTSSRPGETPSMKFMYGPLAVAMREGHILLLNEIDLMDSGELSGLNDILEGRPLVIAANGGEIIKPHPMFRVFVTGNSVGQGDDTGLYQGVNMQNIAAMDRYMTLVVGYVEEEVEKIILEKAVGDLPESIREKMITVANRVRKLFTGDDNSGGQISVTMSTRTLRRWAKKALSFNTAPNAIEYALERSLLNRCSIEEQTAILRIAKDVFGSQWK